MWYLRPRFPLLAALSSLLALGVWACKDKGGGVTDPTQDKPVASVTVAPATVNLTVGDTVRFRASLFDAEGSQISGRRVVWASSPQTVATIDSTGLATGVAGGQATITASAEGRSGTAAAAVAPAQDVNVLAEGNVGSSGGSVGTANVGITIPPGELTSTTKIEILKAEDPIEEFGANGVTETYLLRGFPTDRDVDVRVRLKVTGTLSEQSYVGLAVPVVRSSTDSTEIEPGLLMREARDSAGYLVATVPVRGQGSGASPSAGAQGAPASAAGLPDLLDGLLGGISAVRADTVPGGHFVIVSWGEPRSQLQTKVSRIVKLMEDARTTVTGMGYSLDHRTRWPMDVRVYPFPPGKTALASFSQMGPFPLDPNTGWFEFTTTAFDLTYLPGIAIHEYFHFVQARYTRTLLEDERNRYRWVKEASSTWIMERAPENVGPYRDEVMTGFRGNLFIGVYPDLTAKHGYGKAPLIKYVADRWGTEQVRQIWANVGSGVGAVDAVLQGFREPAATWWPDLLTRYMKGEMYAIAAADLPPPGPELTLEPGFWSYSRNLRPLAASAITFTPKPGAYGTGTTLKLRLPKGASDLGFKFVPFRIDAAGNRWEPFGAMVDSLDIPGPDLSAGRRFVVYMVHTTPTAPYTVTWSVPYVTDLGYIDGDWVTGNVSVVQDAITYVRPEGDTNGIDVSGNIAEIFTSLASGGVWKRTAADPDRYVWEPTPEFAQALALYKATVSSEAVVPVTEGLDSLYLKATFDMNPPAAPVGEPGQAAAFGGAALLLLTGIALRRRRRVLMVATLGAVGLGAWGCDLGSINFTAKFSYDFAFANPALVASAEDPTLPLVTLSGGSGTMKVERYRSEWWKYIRDDKNAIVDSVPQVRTASGQATVTLDAALYNDGVITDDDDDEVAERVSRLLQLPAEAVMGPVRAARPR